MNFSPELLEAVALLDQDQPGWWRRVNLGDFNLNSCSRCVIGQVYNGHSHDAPADFTVHTGRLFPVNTWKVFAGGNLRHEYEPQWRNLIAARQRADRIGEDLSVPEYAEVEGVAV